MSSITIELPLSTYHGLKQIAQRRKTSVSEAVDVLVSQARKFALLPVETEKELNALNYLSDKSLWALTQQTLSGDEEQEWDALNHKSPLTDADAERKEALLGLYDYYVLRRAAALHILHKRGRDISSLLTIPEA